MTDEPNTDANEQAKAHDAEVNDLQDQQKAAEDLRGKADVTTDDVAVDHKVSLTEHATGGNQPDDGTYDAQRANAPLEGRDIPQKIVTAVNDTPTPGETNEVPEGDGVVNRSQDGQ